MSLQEPLEKIGNRERVDISDIGTYLRLIHMDHQPKDNKEMAELIQDTYGVICHAKDIDVYETLHVQNTESEDYEKLSKMSEFNIESLIE